MKPAGPLAALHDVSVSSPYFRTFLVGAVWFAGIGLKMGSRHAGDWSAYSPRNFLVLIIAWITTALFLGVAATRFEKLRSWLGISLGTVAGSLVVLGLMVMIAERVYGPPKTPKFKTTDEMMAYLASEATKWVRKDRSIDLDYSVDSIRIIDEELGRISKEVDKEHPQRGTLGVAMGYGAYIG
ncbi:MAG TPA: hypothetical protein VKM56_10805, partial [Verrucomicrobiae bacterium]|nr:hypothetical protein [Verrucomicrobiae bacterium]